MIDAVILVECFVYFKITESYFSRKVILLWVYRVINVPYSYILIKFEVYIVRDFIFIRKNYAFIRGLYFLQFTIIFIMCEFMKFPLIYLWYLFIYLFLHLFIHYLFIRKLYLLEVMLLD